MAFSLYRATLFAVLVSKTSEHYHLNTTTLSTFVFQNSSKIWFRYAEKILFLTITKSYHVPFQNTKRMIPFFSKSVKVTKRFTVYSRSTQAKHLGRNSLVMKPLGRLRMEHIHRVKPFSNFSTLFVNYFSGLFQSRFCPKWRWDFAIHKMFQLNITFHYIYSSAIDFNQCHFARFEVRMINPKCFRDKDRIRLNSQKACGLTWLGTYSGPPQTSPHPETVTFCGIHSQTTVFSPHQITYLAVFSPEYTGKFINQVMAFADTLISFGIIDSCGLKTVHFHNYSSSRYHPIQLIQVLLLNDIMSLLFYKLQASKTKLVQFQVLGIFKNWLIFDGPGTLSPQIANFQHNGNFSEFKTSTFQCVILGERDINQDKIAFAETKSCSKALELFVDPNERKQFQFTITKGPTPTKFSFLKLKTSPGHQINATVLFFDYSATINTPECSYAGVSGYDSVREIGTICPKTATNSLSDIQHKFLSLYSSQNVFYFVMYSYKEYTCSDVSMIFSTTLCKPVAVNICKWIEKTIHKLSLKMKTLVKKFLLMRKTNFFPITGNTCSIVQLQNSLKFPVRYGKTIIEKCALTVAFNNTDMNATQLNINLTSYFTGIFISI